MKAIDTNFLEFLGKSNFSFVIPVYQRNYNWNNEQCSQLIHDLELILKNNLTSYFLGSVVYINENQSVSLSSVNEVFIIDGQQRITTLSLLLVAISEALNDETAKLNLRESYILNSRREGKEKIKLKPIKDDMTALVAIINNDEHIAESAVTINYLYFVDYLKESNYSPEQIFEAIGKLMIVDISLTKGIDNPQMIFESLNSTGLELSSSDLIRNFVLMNLSYKDQEFFYTNYWKKIENNCQFKTDEFIRHYITLKEGYIPNIGKVYKAFKAYRQKNLSLEVKDLLEEILFYSTLYNQFETGRDSSYKIANRLFRLKNLDNTVTYPFLLDLFYDYKNNLITEDIVERALHIIETYIVRRFVCEAQTNAMNKIFMSLAREIKKDNIDWITKYIDIMSHVLANKSASGRTPNNHEVVESLKSRDIYNMKAKNKIFLLESFENFNNKEKVDVYGGLENAEISIEHIMPQTLTKEWKEELGKDFQRIHDEYLNVLGNLTLTGYNSNFKNKPFKEKKRIGFSDSRFWLNSYVKNQDNWNEETIKDRCKILTAKFLTIWPELQFDNSFFQATENIISLSEEYNFTSKHIKALIFLGDRIEINSFRDLKIEILKRLYLLDSNLFFKIQENDLIGKRFFSHDPNDLRSSVEVVTGIFIEVHMSAQSIIKDIKRIIPFYAISEDDIEVVLEIEK